MGDIIEKNYRQPIYRNFSNYRQIIDIEFWEFGNYQKIIDIENCIQFYPINTIESIVLKTRKGPQRSTEKLLVARDFWCSKANTDSVMVPDIKSVVRSTTREHVKQKYVVSLPLMRILWNKDSDSGSTGFVFESICAKLVLYDF